MNTSVLDQVLSTSTIVSSVVFALAADEGNSKRDERVANCSTHYHRQIRAQNGKWRAVLNRCGVIAECAVCREIKVDSVRESLIDVAKSDTAKVREMSEEEGKKFCRRIGAEFYRRFPLEGDTCVIIFDDAGNAETGEEFDNKKLSSMDWDTVAIPPTGKRVTGKLGIRLVSSSGKTKVKVVQISAPSATEKQWKEAAETTNRITADFNPKTLEELKICLDKRAGLMGYQLQKMGVDHTVRLVTDVFDMKDLNWLDNAPVMETPPQLNRGVG